MTYALHPEFPAQTRDHIVRGVIGRFIDQENAIELDFLRANHARKGLTKPRTR